MHNIHRVSFLHYMYLYEGYNEYVLCDTGLKHLELYK